MSKIHRRTLRKLNGLENRKKGKALCTNTCILSDLSLVFYRCGVSRNRRVGPRTASVNRSAHVKSWGVWGIIHCEITCEASLGKLNPMLWMVIEIRRSDTQIPQMSGKVWIHPSTSYYN